MKIKDTDLNLFIAFDVIYTEKNLTKSGQVLGITQPAVSNALARLRDLFNDELFIRTSRGMIPTPVANQLIGDIRNALSLIQNTISVSEKFDPSTAEMTFKISIGLFFSVIIYYLSNFSYVLGSTERISLIFSIFIPIIILSTINCLMLYRVNEK